MLENHPDAYLKCSVLPQLPREENAGEVRVAVPVAPRRGGDVSLEMKIPVGNLLVRRTVAPGARPVGLLKLGSVAPLNDPTCTNSFLRSSLLLASAVFGGVSHDIDHPVHRLHVTTVTGDPHPVYGPHTDPRAPYLKVVLLPLTAAQEEAGGVRRDVRFARAWGDSSSLSSDEFVLRDVLASMFIEDPRAYRALTDRLMLISRVQAGKGVTPWVTPFYRVFPLHPGAGFSSVGKWDVLTAAGNYFVCPEVSGVETDIWPPVCAW